MKKRLLVLGLAAMMLTGCGKNNHDVEVTTEKVSLIDKKIEQITYNAEKLNIITELIYLQACEEIIGDEFTALDATYWSEGIYFKGETLTWEELDEYILENALLEQWW